MIFPLCEFLRDERGCSYCSRYKAKGIGAFRDVYDAETRAKSDDFCSDVRPNLFIALDEGKKRVSYRFGCKRA